MTEGKNIFGGGNPRSLYTPMSETEQEVLERLIQANDLEVNVVGWGVVTQPRITFGDLRISLVFRLDFNAPEVYVPVHYFDLELRTRNGFVIFSERQPTLIGGLPIQIKNGSFIDLAWDIAIQKMNPEFVRMVKPGATGLTSRDGNMKLDETAQQLLKAVRQGEARVRDENLRQAEEATRKADGEA